LKKTALAMLLVAVPLAAQNFEAGVFLGQQSYKSVSSGSWETKVSSKTVAGVRFGYSIVDLGPALFQITAGYQPKVKSDLEFNGIKEAGSYYSHEHTSVGAMFNFKAGVAFGAGVEYRFEKLGGESIGEPTEYSSFSRPWVRANVGYAFPSPVVKPFLGLEVAVPLTSKSYSASETSTKEALKWYAPKLQIGIYGGIRF